ncbi:hypothetical protein TNCV_937681 [Trichonephila clavipes]|nr:hypothetical protein TNCV_937681 [Trichonephila clavipes]
MRSIGDGPRNFEPWLRVEDDTLSPSFTLRKREGFEPQQIKCASATLLGVSSVELVFKTVTQQYLPRIQDHDHSVTVATTSS